MSDEVEAPMAEFGLALSGGGARAMAFHLGCLRALHRHGLLARIDTIASVSGGSVIAALYCQHPGDFASFETRVRAELAQGFVGRSLTIALTTLEGVKALAFFWMVLVDRIAAATIRWTIGWIFPQQTRRLAWTKASLFYRRYSRTTILRRTFDRLYGEADLTDLRDDRPRLIIVACELQARSAFYFAKEKIGSWRLGEASARGVRSAYAVMASAAFPAALPALDKMMDFTKTVDGQAITQRARVTLTDGGVYDNLGLAPFWPGRERGISLFVARHRRIIACRAGYGLDMIPPISLWPSRMLGVVESLHARSQNLAVNRLFDLQRAGLFDGVILPYLDQNDAELTHKPANYLNREDVSGYPTNFSKMAPSWIERLSRRGEQQVDALIAQYWSDIVTPPDGRL
jgi:NTE family protein